MKERLAFFDFDGTITRKDTLLEFIKYNKGKWYFYIGFLLNLPYLVLYRLKIISNQTAKEKILRFFFGRTPLDLFNEKCTLFSTHALPDLIRPKAQREIKNLQDKNFTVVIVSASPENWIKDWAEKNKLQLIATRLMVHNGRLTGKIMGRNCHGKEKVRRIKEKFSLSEAEMIYAYGDNSGDRPMLSIANCTFFKPFR